jgi:rod shape-determining protein MreC
VRAKRQGTFRLLLLVLFLIILIFRSKSITNDFRTGIGDHAALPLRALDACKSSLVRLIPFASLREENGILRNRIDLLSRQIDEARGLDYENQRLKALIDFRKTISYKTICARVIGRDPSNWSNSIIIDKGSDDGVLWNKAVISPRGLVGRTLEVGRRSAKILLITDPGSRVGVVVQRNRQGGMLVGRPDGKCKMIYIALNSDVGRSDKVVTAGFGGVFPRDIIVGEVLSVEKEPGRLSKYAVIKTAEDMTRLEEVMCVR